MFDTYTESTMGRMKVVKSKDGEWRRMGDELEADSDEDEDNNHIEGGCQPFGNLDIPPLQVDISELELGDIPYAEVPPVVDESPLYEVRAQISSLTSRIEELAVVKDSRLSSIEACIDLYKTQLTSQYEQLQQRVNQFEQKVMGFLESIFPPPLPTS